MKLAEFFLMIKTKWIQVFAFTILMVLCTLPFSVTVSKVFIFACLFFWLINPKKDIREIKKAQVKYVVIICAGYLVLFLGLIYTQNLSAGFHIIESKLTLLVLPVIIIFSKLKKEHVRFILACFTVTLIIASLYCLYESYKVFLVFENSSAFFNIEFVSPLKIHPNYLALYVSVSILFLISSVVESKGIVRIAVSFSIIFLLIISLLLLSRIVMFALFVSLLMAFLIFYEGRLKYGLLTVFLAVSGLTSFLAYTYIDSFQIRMNDAFSLDNYSHEPVWSSSSGTHFKSWTCAVESLRNGHFILGHGTGDELDVLLDCYADHNWDEMVKQKLNSHNEYLSATMRCGILGFATLLAMLYQSFYFAIRAKDIVLFGFIFIVALFFATGSLGMMHGVVFFGLVNSMLLKRCLEIE